jgi:hypothetical protein
MRSTKRCIVCLKKATIFGGHVVDATGKRIYAGWCDEHFNTPNINLLGKYGCYGGWHPKYGVKKDKTIY